MDILYTQYGTLAYKRCCVAAKTLTIRETLFLNLKFRKSLLMQKSIFLLQLKPISKRIWKTISPSNTIKRPMILIFGLVMYVHIDTRNIYVYIILILDNFFSLDIPFLWVYDSRWKSKLTMWQNTIWNYWPFAWGNTQYARIVCKKL